MEMKHIKPFKELIAEKYKIGKKTFRQVFNEFPHPYNKQAIEAMEDEDVRYFNVDDRCHYNSKSDALFNGFVWDDSVNGEKYWRSFYELLKASGE
jgi:hypothetical protein